MKRLRLAGLLVLALALTSMPANADVGSWGVGAFLNYDLPTLGFSDWYGNGTKWGITGSFVPAEMVTVEVEYHRTTFNDPKVESATFEWTDGAQHKSPDASSSMRFNSLLVNALVKWQQIGEPFRASSFAPYVAVGAGFYRYKHNVSGLLWPGQKDALVIEMEPYRDQRFALGFNAGLGVEAFARCASPASTTGCGPWRTGVSRRRSRCRPWTSGPG